MYAVVGCRDCGALWVVEGRPETTGCPRCGTRHRFEKLHRFAETDDEDAARRARSTLLAERSDRGDATDAAEAFDALEDRLEAAGVSDDVYLAGSGLDVEAVAAAGERAEGGPSTGSASRREVVVGALEALESPTEEAVIEYAAERGVPPEAARSVLGRLVRAGEVSESRGRYRRL